MWSQPEGGMVDRCSNQVFLKWTNHMQRRSYPHLSLCLPEVEVKNTVRLTLREKKTTETVVYIMEINIDTLYNNAVQCLYYSCQ